MILAPANLMGGRELREKKTFTTGHFLVRQKKNDPFSSTKILPVGELESKVRITTSFRWIMNC